MSVLLLLIAYFFADYLLQSDFIREEKWNQNVMLLYLFYHFITSSVSLVSYFFVFDDQIRFPYLLVTVVLVVISRLGVEWLKVYCSALLKRYEGSKKVPDVLSNQKLFLAVMDLLLHALVLLVISCLLLDFNLGAAVQTYFQQANFLYGGKQPILLDRQEIVVFMIFIFLFVTVVSGRIISLIIPKPIDHDFDTVEGKLTLEADSHSGSYYLLSKKLEFDRSFIKLETSISRGKTIGYVERILLMTLVFYGQYTAIAFMMTAKSVYRFKQLDHREWAEYYLFGTVASCLFGVACGLLLHVYLP